MTHACAAADVEHACAAADVEHACAAADVEHTCAAPRLRAEECTRMLCGALVNGSRLTQERVKFCFFLCSQKKYSSILIKLRLNHWCHIDYFIDVVFTFLCLDRGSSLTVYGGSESSLVTSLNLCSEDERRSYEFGTTWGCVINDRIFGWTNSFAITGINYILKYI